MARTHYIAGNWKMNTNKAEAVAGLILVEFAYKKLYIFNIYSINNAVLCSASNISGVINDQNSKRCRS